MYNRAIKNNHNIRTLSEQNDYLPLNLVGDYFCINLTFDGVFFTLSLNGGGWGLILSTLLLLVKTIEKVELDNRDL